MRGQMARGAAGAAQRDNRHSARLKDILPPICTALAEGGAGDSALHIRDAIAAKV